ncbi:MAG TPA: hypothetical protein VIW78_04920 [Burkholderiales bacterium]
MARFLHSIAKPLTAFVAGSFPTTDLPVNPLSLVFLNLEITRANPAAGAVYKAVDDLLDNVTSVVIKHKGENIIAGSLKDLLVVNMVTHQGRIGWSNLTDVSGAISRFTIPLGFGRKRYDPLECFPATSRGNLTFDCVRAANPASFTALSLSLETVELIEAQPERYLKYTPNSQTAVVGTFDQALPIGNKYARLVFFDTGLQTLTTGVSSWGQVKLLKDNVEQYYPLSDAQTLAGMLNSQLWSDGVFPGHRHQTVTAVAAGVFADEADEAASKAFRGYFQMDFDPNRDEMYLMDTAGAADIKLRALGTSATAVRVTPVEIVTVKK